MKFTNHDTPLILDEPVGGKFTFDGTFYYFTLFAQNAVIQTKEDFQERTVISTRRCYDCLTFDSVEGCFWASIVGSVTRLFRLDCHLQEVDCLCIPSLGGRIVGISHMGCQDSLLLAYPNEVALYSKETGILTPLLHSNQLISGILGLCSGYLLLQRQGEYQVISSYFLKDTLIQSVTVPSPCRIRCMGYNPCICQTPRLDFLHGNCYPKMATIPVEAHDLGFQPCICAHRLCNHCCSPKGDPVDHVLESIALIEAALSHILNAQGEELQRVVAESSDIQEMLQCNKDIHKTITKVTHLEQVLCSKLEELNHLSQPCEKGR